MPSNTFERLPTEIRYMVYELPGFPVGTYAWLDCPGPTYCADGSHVIFHEDAKWPMTWHVLPGIFSIRKKIEQVIIQRYGGGLKIPNLQIKYKMGNEVLKRKLDLDVGLLNVSKTIRSELLSLLFGNIDVALEYPLTIQSSLLTHITRLTLSGSTLRLQLQAAVSALHMVKANCRRLRYLTLIVECTVYT